MSFWKFGIGGFGTLTIRFTHLHRYMHRTPMVFDEAFTITGLFSLKHSRFLKWKAEGLGL